jgi:cytoskeletal protein CcmA (bactofilin family)
VIVKSLIRLIVLLLSAAAAAVVAPRAAVAQQDSSGARLSSTVRTAVEGYNASTTRRVTGAFSVPASTVVAGDVAVLNGPVTISGRIQGSLIAINADVRLEPSARVDQNITVIGGTLTGHDGAQIGGEIRRQEELLRYRLEGERLIAESELVYDDSWWQRHHIRHEIRRGEAYTEFFYVASRAYNRVEGWSFAVGPRIQRAPSWGKINLDAFAIVRTAAPIVWGDQSLGHEANAEVQFGKPIGVAVGGQLFSVIAPTENWQMGNGEVGLASFLLRRDFRDYYARHGGEMYVRFQGGNDADLTFTLSDEQWRDRRDRDPFTLFRGNELWRANPVMDSGSMHLFTARLRADTRGQEGSRWAGWYVNLEFEQGAGRLTRAGAPIIATLLAPLARVHRRAAVQSDFADHVGGVARRRRWLDGGRRASHRAQTFDRRIGDAAGVRIPRSDGRLRRPAVFTRLRAGGDAGAVRSDRDGPDRTAFRLPRRRAAR